MTTNWIRRVFFISGFINMIGAVFFVPQLGFGRTLLGLSANVHPVYLFTIASWIFLFGIAYFYLGITGKTEKLFVFIGASGKLFFGICLIVYYLRGEASIWAVSAALTDIGLAAIFLFWLYQLRVS